MPTPSGLTAVDVLRLGTLGLRTRRARTALSCLGIAIGIAAMIAVVGISSSSKAALIAELDRLGTGLLAVQPGQTFSGDPAVIPALAPAMIRRIAGVDQITDAAAVDAHVYRTKLIPVFQAGGIATVAVRPDLLGALRGTVRNGRFLNAATINYPAVVLGAATARQLGIPSVQTRPRIWIGGHWFTVVGVLDPLPLAPDLDTAALVGFPIAKRILGFNGSIGTIYVRARPSQTSVVRQLLPATVLPPHPEGVSVSRPSDLLAARATAEHAFTGLLIGLGSVALLVGGIGIANVMVIAVLERRSEIGLRRALGATRRHIALQFLAEAFFLSALGGLAGVLLGEVTTIAYALSRSWDISIPLYAAAAGLAAAVLTGVAAGSYPALRAARLAPTDALRTA